MSAYLPNEVLFNIFLKLPVKTLGLCSCVSKSWHSVIASSIFISAHLNHAATRDKKWLLFRRCSSAADEENERYSLHLDTETLDLYQELELPIVNPNGNGLLVGVCNGLVCCLSGLNILLWNPSIRRGLAIPWTSEIIGARDNCAIGFGFDSRANDYKVVRLLTSFYGNWPPLVELYELRTGSWREISDRAPRCAVVQSGWTQAFVNGAVHWVASGEDYKCFILRFDIIEECFSTVALPEYLVNCSPRNLQVAVLGGALAIMMGGRFDNYVSSVWLLRKHDMPESWTHLISCNRSMQWGRVLGLKENGEVLMTSKSGELVLHKPENGLTMGLDIHGAEDSFYLDTYVESLVFLNERDRNLGERS